MSISRQRLNSPSLIPLLNFHFLCMCFPKTLFLFHTNFISQLILIAEILFLKQLYFVPPIFFRLNSIHLVHLKDFFLFFQSPVLKFKFFNIDHQIFNPDPQAVVPASWFTDLHHPGIMISELNRRNFDKIEFLWQFRIDPPSLNFQSFQFMEQSFLQISQLLFLQSQHMGFFDFLFVLTDKLNQYLPLLS